MPCSCNLEYYDSMSPRSDSKSDFNEIQHYFPANEWKEMSSYEKRSYANMARNYEAMIKAGLQPKKPKFMTCDLEHSKQLTKLSSEQSEPKKPKASDRCKDPVRFSPRIRKMLKKDEQKMNDAQDSKRRDLLGRLKLFEPFKRDGSTLNCLLAAAKTGGSYRSYRDWKATAGEADTDGDHHGDPYDFRGTHGTAGKSSV